MDWPEIYANFKVGATHRICAAQRYILNKMQWQESTERRTGVKTKNTWSMPTEAVPSDRRLYEKHDDRTE
ncbi:hypothetical protein TNCV_1858741 [Trichonephila clavipes]|nr:hypothetical protein TNCV_1858741 [Trichonephila clavipes]